MGSNSLLEFEGVRELNKHKPHWLRCYWWMWLSAPFLPHSIVDRIKWKFQKVRKKKSIHGRKWYILSSGSFMGIHSRFPTPEFCTVPLPLAEFTCKFLSMGVGWECTFCFHCGEQTWQADSSSWGLPRDMLEEKDRKPSLRLTLWRDGCWHLSNRGKRCQHTSYNAQGSLSPPLCNGDLVTHSASEIQEPR